MKLNLIFIFLVTAAINFNACLSEKEPEELPIVQVKQGQIKGNKEKSLSGKEFYSYMSIPYAKPPVDSLRFKDPVPTDSWDETLDGTRLPTFCLQFGIFDYFLEFSLSMTILGKEDCLYLNVYTSEPNNADAKLPVMVFIHGGSFIAGSSHEYRPYVLLNEDIILVVVQYRLGIFGFLSTEDSVLPGNMGLKDQQLALKWVKENIEAFGGDSERITIFGESAGAASIHYQMLSPGSQGLFHRAILQSGTALCPWASNINHKKFALETGSIFNCSATLGTEAFLECIQKIDAYYLLLASRTAKWGLTPLYVLPRVDGEFLPDEPETLMKEGKYHKVDVLSGLTRDEGAMELLRYHSRNTKYAEISNQFEKNGPLSLMLQDEMEASTLAENIYKHYLQTDEINISKDDNDKLVEIFSDRGFGYCHDVVANFHARDDDINLYLYVLNHSGQLSILNVFRTFNRKNWISHSDDLPYLFFGGPLFSLPMKNEVDLKLRDIMVSLWTNFAKTGKPTTPETNFVWEPATSESFRHLSLTTTPEMEDDKFIKSRQFWGSLKTRQNSLLNSEDKMDIQKEEL